MQKAIQAILGPADMWGFASQTKDLPPTEAPTEAPTASPTASPTTIEASNLPEELQSLMSKLDDARQDEGVSSLVWDSSLATLAMNHAEKCDYGINVGRNEGQSVYVGEHVGAAFAFSVQAAVNLAPSSFPSTEIKGPTTERIGCGFAVCPNLFPEYVEQNPSGKSVFVVCDYGAMP